MTLSLLNELNNDRYNKVARDYHEDFDEYLASLEPIGIDELREGAKSNSAYSLLERYVYGISPAFSYGMNK